ncbi:MAG TPA: hypothetical protein VE870_00150 [Bacteroidales bacterium]|nr:hypothetical protein [Bacteroidales bacterium]
MNKAEFQVWQMGKIRTLILTMILTTILSVLILYCCVLSKQPSSCLPFRN